MTKLEAMTQGLHEGVVQLVVVTQVTPQARVLVKGVPSKHFEAPELRLNFSRSYGTEVKLDNDGAHQRLRFDGWWADVFVPWAVVSAIILPTCAIIFPPTPAEAQEAAKKGLRLVANGEQEE